MNYSFIELQKQYKVVIPKIQRDYAQGREDSNNDNKIVSYDFILKIIEVISTESPALNLDFVYGYTKEISKNHFAFYPLDGQQRLTTLWLLYWYLAPKDFFEINNVKMMSVSSDVKEWLGNFTYETRNSSKRFCEELINKMLPISNNVYSTIKDATWFMASWENDPTVVSMLKMIETIQVLSFDKELAWNNLYQNRKITFDYIDIKSDEFKLTDELYIKMNSRGKPLTPFENFKARFSEILSSKDTDYVNETLEYEGVRVSFPKYFAFNIDSIWTDLFWNYEMSVNKDISSCFMNFFTYIAQMCFFKDNTNKNANDFKNEFSVFKRKENALFLFNTLNFFCSISTDESKQVTPNKINVFFEELFQNGKIDSSYHGQIRLFEEKGVNLFEKCLLEGNQFDNRNKILLYCIISYAIKFKLKEVNYDLRIYVRVLRNLLQATRQRNEIVYNTNVRINSFGKYWKLFKQLQEKPNTYERLLDNITNKETDISDEALNNEKEKAKIVVNNNTVESKMTLAIFQLEEFRFFGGLIHNLNPKSNFENFIDWSKYIREIWSCSDNLLVASLIACEFGGVYIKRSRLGGLWFWGQKDNWSTILTGQSNSDNNLSESIISLLIKYGEKKHSLTNFKPNEVLEIIVKEYFDSLSKKGWEYYFCKYKKFFLTNSNYYSWKSDEFEHEILGNTGFNPLLSYHINPYVKAVSNLLENSICLENWCYARYSDDSCIVLNNDYSLYSQQNGWLIELPKKGKISEGLKQKYDIHEDLILKETNYRDRIEIAVDFCTELSKNV